MIDWLRREAIEPEIELGDRTLPIDLIRNRRAKRLTLRLAPDGSAVRITLPRRLQRWLEAEALRLFAADARDYCTAAGLDTASVKLTRARKRWGSCSSEGVLRLNWRLVQAPDAIRRSVVAHEVAHLVHFDHSPAFHALLGELYEGDIDQANRWLSRHGRELYAAFD